jgi:3-oxoadipate CoA-transferase beta subunit
MCRMALGVFEKEGRVTDIVPMSRKDMARRVAQDVQEGWYVNLGIGIPTMIADFISNGREVVLHSENGILGMGPNALAGQDRSPTHQRRQTACDSAAGGAFFHHADSFAMIRGGHIDLCALGAFEVAQNGDLANWATSAADAAPAVGGAMDLAGGAKHSWVVTEHTTKEGAPKLVERCSYPPTALGAVSRIYTNLAVIDVTAAGFSVREMVPSLTLAMLKAQTAASSRLTETIDA